MENQKLLAIVEQGGYPNFTQLYQRHGFEVVMVHSMRKAISLVKKLLPDVIVAEFNYQSDYRDRTSSLESLLATVERFSREFAHKNEHAVIKKSKVIVFYDKEYVHQLQKLSAVFRDFQILSYPIPESELEKLLV